MPLFCCELENAPDYPDDEGKRSPKSIILAKTDDSLGIVQLALLKADLSTIPETRLNKRPGANGRWYYKINYEIQMICGSANTTFLLVFDNRPIGRVEAEFV